MRDIIIYGLLTVYFCYSVVYSKEFYKSDKFYSKRQKILHIILIWAIPFIWILLLKSLGQKTLGSHHYRKARREHPLDVGDGTNSIGDGHDGFHESGTGF